MSSALIHADLTPRLKPFKACGLRMSALVLTPRLKHYKACRLRMSALALREAAMRTAALQWRCD